MHWAGLPVASIPFLPLAPKRHRCASTCGSAYCGTWMGARSCSPWMPGSACPDIPRHAAPSPFAQRAEITCQASTTLGCHTRCSSTEARQSTTPPTSIAMATPADRMAASTSVISRVQHGSSIEPRSEREFTYTPRRAARRAPGTRAHGREKARAAGGLTHGLPGPCGPVTRGEGNSLILPDPADVCSQLGVVTTSLGSGCKHAAGIDSPSEL